MGWRSIVITKPSSLKLQQSSIVVNQDDGAVRVPLEDVSIIVMDNPQIMVSHQLLSACAEQQIAVITVNQNHLPNGVLLPYCPHSRALQVMEKQLAMRLPQRKRLWRTLIHRKILNQGQVLMSHGAETVGASLIAVAKTVKSGDSDHREAYAGQLYFPALFGKGFGRRHNHFYNSALNYGYAIVRAAIARTLVSFGLITAKGIHHHNEQNGFNLADDLIEPYRPIIDSYVLKNLPNQDHDKKLDTVHKALLIQVLHQDISMMNSSTNERDMYSLLAAIESSVISLVQRLNDQGDTLHLPLIQK